MSGVAKKRVVVLISGRGSNMSALIEAAKHADFPAKIVGVISNKADAHGLAIAATHDIEAKAITRADHPTKEKLDAALDAELKRLKADIVCLAGYMRLLTPEFTQNWAGRIINIHPSLLPLFPGLDTHARALAAGMRLHGCTVHFVTAEMDAGPIIAQAAIPVMPGDDADSLSSRVLKAEHQLYPMALQLVAEGRARMEDGRAVLTNVTASGSLLSPMPAREGLDMENLARLTP
ncbi:phosphoribosylglycinamide formyltransferase [Aliihoeflea sp. PC F10.4]